MGEWRERNAEMKVSDMGCQPDRWVGFRQEGRRTGGRWGRGKRAGCREMGGMLKGGEEW